MSFEEKLTAKICPPANTMHLQGIPGYLPAIHAADLKPGMVAIWNFGYKSVVLDVQHSKTGKTITATMKSLESGYTAPRKMSASRLVVIDGR